MTTNSKTYDAFLFRQRPDAPLQVAFVAASSEIDAWARVPTKQTANIRNFQRAELPIHIKKEVQKFFQNKQNASPTAVVVGFDPIRSQGRVITRDKDGKVATAMDVQPGEPVRGTIEVHWEADADPTEQSAVHRRCR